MKGNGLDRKDCLENVVLQLAGLAYMIFSIPDIWSLFLQLKKALVCMRYVKNLYYIYIIDAKIKMLTNEETVEKIARGGDCG